jgi:multidrug efflux pump subunit AcrB
MIGMIALAGIIVRNSILLVDFINEQVAGGMDFAEAVIQAAAVRAKPIVLTGWRPCSARCSSSTTRSSTASRSA